MSKSFCSGVAAVAALLLISVAAIPASDAARAARFDGRAALFDGKSLAGWHVQGGADWRVANGAIIGTTKNGAGGWLVLDRGYEDLVLRLTFQCNGDCGVLLRRQSTEGGGASGVYVPLTGKAVGAFLQVALDGQGNEISRKVLLADRPRPRFVAPILITSGGDGWNQAQIKLRGPVVPPPENVRLMTGWGSYRNLPFPSRVRVNFGEMALHVSSGELRVKEISVEDLIRRRTGMPVEVTDSAFHKIELTRLFTTEGVAAGTDFNHDGIMDVVAGPYYYPGPDYQTGIEIYPPLIFDTNWPGLHGNDPDSGVMFAYDFNGDGWPDVLRVNFEGAFLYINPKTESRHWDAYKVADDVASENPLFADVDGDGKPELVTFVHPGPEKRSGFTSPLVMGYFKPGPDPTRMWPFHAISTPAVWGAHSLGVGDINKDGKVEIIHGTGWWEQPAAGAASGLWKFHPAPFNRGGGDTHQRGANMFVYDVNGDGLPDVITSLYAHGPGLAWFEQQKNAQGAITWKMHLIMGSPTASAEERKTWEETDKSVAFTGLHALAMADMDGDGMQDIVTGTRWWSGSESTQYDISAPPVLYWFKLVRKRGGRVEFIPHMISNRADLGKQVIAVDLNDDGKPDVVIAGRTGALAFLNHLKKR